MFEGYSHCPEACKSEAVHDLLYASPLWSLAERLTGGQGQLSAKAPQVVLTFPGAASGPFHLDGIAVTRGEVESHTLTFCVPLVDLPSNGFYGGLDVLPGSHRMLSRWVQENPPDRLDYLQQGSYPPPQVCCSPMSGATPIAARRGDATLLHYATLHRSGSHSGYQVSAKVYFRLTVAGHTTANTLEYLWDEWTGLRRSLGGDSHHLSR